MLYIFFSLWIKSVFCCRREPPIIYLRIEYCIPFYILFYVFCCRVYIFENDIDYFIDCQYLGRSTFCYFSMFEIII